MAGDPTVDTLGESGTYQYLVDYWVEPRVYAEAPPTGWGEEFEEEDRAIQLQKKREGFVGMIRTEPNRNQNREAAPAAKSYVFHVPIATTNYKAAPFDYQAVNQTSMAMVGGLTRSGRVYDQNKKEVPEGSRSEKEENGEHATLIKLMKASEYKVVEQMAKIPAQISLMSLLLTSDHHREMLFKVLKEVKVPEGISTDKLGHVVNSVFTLDQISFSPEELGEEGTQHTKPLFIVVKCHEKIVSRVLIDNGSSLNVCPLATLHLLGIDITQVKPSTTTVRAFDGSKREIAGEIDLEIEVGPQAFIIPFQVLDIPRSFNLLLGRPWIHFAGAIPSSLHQKVKFITNGQIITVLGEQDYSIYKDTAIPYIGEEGPEDFGLQIFEQVCVLEGGETTQVGTFGLGYTPTMEEVQEMKLRIRGKKGELLYHTPIEIPNIKSTFPQPAYIQGSEPTEEPQAPNEQSDEQEENTCNCQPILNNWFSIPVYNVRPTLE